MAHPLASPIAFRMPEYLAPSAWTEHLPFAGWLVAALAPRLLVELGTHAGTSYMGFCQAVRELGLPTRCAAVDTWDGDAHAGFYSDDVYTTLKREHDQRYAAFSKLMRMRFDDALSHFQDGSIDLLHIDGLHTYDAVRHDFESWLPKLSGRAVVLFHDTAEPGFGVGQFWKEVTATYPGFQFVHGHGLGVLLVGSEAPPLLKALATDGAAADEASRLFSALGRLVATDSARMHFERLVVIRDRQLAEARDSHADAESRAGQWQRASEEADERCHSLASTLADVQQQLAATRAERDDANLTVSGLRAALTASEAALATERQAASDARERASASISRLDARVQELTEAVHAQAEGIARIEREREEFRQALAECQAMLDSVLSSRSWRITAPLRRVSMLVKGWRR